MAEEAIKKYEELFNKIKELHGISDIWLKTLQLLEKIERNKNLFSDESLTVICIYFSLLDDGNTCISLNHDILKSKWERKWDGLVTAASKKKKDCPDPLSKEVLCKGIADLKSYKGNNPTYDNLFVIEDNWFYAKKYHDAKEDINNRLGILFSDKSKRASWTRAQLFLSPATIKDKNEGGKQQSAVEKGLKNNIIISGGPGTGKTTVAYEIIKNVLINLKDEIENWDLYLTAPTGKAADRLKESIEDRLADNEDHTLDIDSPVRGIIKETKSCTIHTLLKYSPEKNNFTYNENNRFSDHSIFVIDEASMIDICLFSSLLKAIPNDAMVFILGDKDQLPSVDAGAVLGSVLGNDAKDNDYTVILEKSYRQEESPKIWDAAQYINKCKPGLEDRFFEYQTDYLLVERDEKKLKELVDKWTDLYFSKVCKTASDYSFEYDKVVFDITKQTKMLCAERQGKHGVEGINKSVLEKLNHKTGNRDYFPGELLMITKNNKLLELSNGDNGVVVHFKDDDPSILWLMIKKGKDDEGTEKQGIFTRGGYTYYPLNQIPSDSIEVSYAMTIHKSQGSGYDNVMIILPKKSGHPLLNRQILYTALTRAKKSVTLVASEEEIKYAIKNVVSRDTMINFNC